MLYNIFVSEDKKQPAGQQLNINLDQTPILYTDNIMVTSNDDGVVLDFFARGWGILPQARVVARIGMSPAHAKKFLMILKDQLDKNSKTGQTGNKAIN